jgi:hypothetical protein
MASRVKININTDFLFSPLMIFILYTVVSCLAIHSFYLFFPGKPVPLSYFSFPWRLIQGFLSFLSLFPALSLSALVIPFGFKLQIHEKNNPFSSRFFLSLRTSIITAIAASTLYGLLFTLALPLAQNYEADLLAKSRLYQLAKERAQESASNKNWTEALQFLAICEKIWPQGPEVSRLITEAEIRSEEESLTRPQLPGPKTETWLGGPEPVNAAEALAMAETALTEERYYDAHWLATLGGHLAKPDSPEATAARRLAGRAWAGVNSLTPNARETRAYNTFRLKREGYEALLGNEWIRSYFIFLELLKQSPKDPDAAKYFALSENGVKKAAFFIDEIEETLGKILTGAVFSFPYREGRLVMRISSLETASDCAYGIGAEIMTFDREGRPLYSMTVPYVKILPLVLENGSSLTVLLRSLDREDKTKLWEPEIKVISQNPPGSSEITLPVSWDNFLLLSNIRWGLSGLASTDLKRAAENLGNYGYLPQVFEAELLERFTRPLFLLPFGIFAIALGWQYRALKRPRYMGIPMLGILPLVFNSTIHFSRNWFNDLGILAVVSLGFTTAAIVFAVGIVLLLVLSFILLASKHG